MALIIRHAAHAHHALITCLRSSSAALEYLAEATTLGVAKLSDSGVRSWTAVSRGACRSSVRCSSVKSARVNCVIGSSVIHAAGSDDVIITRPATDWHSAQAEAPESCSSPVIKASN